MAMATTVLAARQQSADVKRSEPIVSKALDKTATIVARAMAVVNGLGTASIQTRFVRPSNDSI